MQELERKEKDYFELSKAYLRNITQELSRASALFQMSRASASSCLLGLSAEEEFRLPHICKNELVRGDKFLICSSIVSEMLSGLEIEDILIRNPDPSRCVRELIDRTRSNGGEDSITAIVCKIS